MILVLNLNMFPGHVMLRLHGEYRCHILVRDVLFDTP